MTRYIKGKDGKMQGSIGDGKSAVPTIADHRAHGTSPADTSAPGSDYDGLYAAFTKQEDTFPSEDQRLAWQREAQLDVAALDDHALYDAINAENAALDELPLHHADRSPQQRAAYDRGYNRVVGMIGEAMDRGLVDDDGYMKPLPPETRVIDPATAAPTPELWTAVRDHADAMRDELDSLRDEKDRARRAWGRATTDAKRQEAEERVNAINLRLGDLESRAYRGAFVVTNGNLTPAGKAAAWEQVAGELPAEHQPLARALAAKYAAEAAG